MRAKTGGEKDATLEVRLHPRAARSGVVGLREGVLEVRVSSPPVEGRANDEARKLLSALLGVPRGRIELALGSRSRRKVFRVLGMAPADLLRKMEEFAKST